MNLDLGKRTGMVAVCLGASGLGGAALGGTDAVNLSYEQPSLDRWMYPFNGSPGMRSSAPVFGAFDTAPDEFDNRDAQLLIGFETAQEVEPGLGAGMYTITSAIVTVMRTTQNDPIYDNTQDSYTTFLEEDDPEFTPDEDAGWPMELFGVGYRNGFDCESFTESSPHGPIFGYGVRNAFAVGFNESGEPIDVANNVHERFDPSPWAIGQIPGLAPGSVIPSGSEYEFDLDVNDPSIQAYLADGLDKGEVRFAVTTLYPSQFQAGNYPAFYCKENILVKIGSASAASLQMTVTIGESTIPEDINGDGVVDTIDLLALLGAWGACDACPEDLNDDGIVDTIDLLALLGAWT